MISALRRYIQWFFINEVYEAIKGLFPSLFTPEPNRPIQRRKFTTERKETEKPSSKKREAVPESDNMEQDIQDCKDLITHYLDQEYLGSGTDAFTFVGETPEKVVQSRFMSLYAQSQSGRKRVNMKSPSLRRELCRLAELGLGQSTIIHGIKYQFIKRALLPLNAPRCNSF
jgi:hypothetical protein